MTSSKKFIVFKCEQQKRKFSWLNCHKLIARCLTFCLSKVHVANKYFFNLICLEKFIIFLFGIPIRVWNWNWNCSLRLSISLYTNKITQCWKSSVRKIYWPGLVCRSVKGSIKILYFCGWNFVCYSSKYSVVPTNSTKHATYRIAT